MSGRGEAKGERRPTAALPRASGRQALAGRRCVRSARAVVRRTMSSRGGAKRGG